MSLEKKLGTAKLPVTFSFHERAAYKTLLAIADSKENYTAVQRLVAKGAITILEQVYRRSKWFQEVCDLYDL